MKPALAAELIRLDEYPDLGADWRALEESAESSPFAAWPWVSTWLRNLPPRIAPLVFRARDEKGLVALALIAHASGTIRQALGGNWLMQETGNHDIDEITIEYAGLLARRGTRETSYRALFDVLTRTRRWHSLRISASLDAVPIAAALPARARAFATIVRPSYLVDLAHVREQGGDYIAQLGSSTRYGLRRTRRAYEALGPIRCEVATDATQALEWFEALRTLHTDYWTSKGKTGSFDSAFFAQFHRDLVKTHCASGFAQIMRVSAGELVVGYLYNLLWRNRVYFYNGGLNYGATDKQDRPGYLAHLAAIERYLAEGIDVYDFLAGDGDYKRKMSTHVRTMQWIQVKRWGLRATIEKALIPWVNKVQPVPLETISDEPSPLRD